ncbi:MAG: RNA polymerase sigma factor, partial [Solirubrobacteraceae bacterium]
TPRSTRRLSTTSRGLLPGAPALTRTGLPPASLDQLSSRRTIREPIELALEELEQVESAASANGWVLELLDRLPPLQRDAVRARILDERSYPDIAGELHTSELVVRQRVSRGLSKLRGELEEQP